MKLLAAILVSLFITSQVYAGGSGSGNLGGGDPTVKDQSGSDLN